MQDFHIQNTPPQCALVAQAYGAAAGVCCSGFPYPEQHTPAAAPYACATSAHCGGVFWIWKSCMRTHWLTSANSDADPRVWRTAKSDRAPRRSDDALQHLSVRTGNHPARAVGYV